MASKPMIKHVCHPGMNGLMVLAIFVFSVLPSRSLASKPTWAKKGINYPARCFSDSVKECRPLRIPSPDGRSLLEVHYRKLMLDDGDYLMNSYLEVQRRDGTRNEVGSSGSVEQEVVWGPDSTSFFVNGSDGGEGPDYVTVYRLSDPDLHPVVITIAAQRDIVESFPPCKAKDADPRDCIPLENHPEYINVNALDWTRGSSAIVVMAEMPCSSRFGGIMCQVLGYELEVSTGKILQRMEAKEFAKRWQHSMAWKFHVPDPPQYEATSGSNPD